MRAARRNDPLLWLALESADEAEALSAMARRAGLGRHGRPPLDVLFRLNPEVTPETIEGLAVGAGASKFGMTETEATGLVEWLTVNARRRDPAARDPPARRVAAACGRCVARRGPPGPGGRRRCCAAELDDFDTLDVGGGFPVLPLDEPGPDPARFARELPALLDAVPADRRPTRLAIEPGRALVARAGWLVARVLHVRERGGRQVVLDAGMTELIRPALYGARHPIVALTDRGPPIEPGAPDLATRPTGRRSDLRVDRRPRHARPPALRRGDLVAIADTGAYAASLASTYNGRPRPAQVFIEPDGQIRLARAGRRRQPAGRRTHPPKTAH